MNALKWDKEFAMEQAADDLDLLQELLTIFKGSLQADVLLIEQGLAEGTPAKVCSAAHSIKGASASLGILGIKEIALAIEEESRAGDLDIARRKLPELQSLLQEVQKL
jgi:HPt (histidine-containing phosphotransfer) domain-containing protein